MTLKIHSIEERQTYRDIKNLRPLRALSERLRRQAFGARTGDNSPQGEKVGQEFEGDAAAIDSVLRRISPADAERQAFEQALGGLGA